MTTSFDASRRHFLRRAGAFSLLGAGAPLALDLAGIAHAAADGASDYKALICVFLSGGNDAYNTVLATDAASWSAYGHERGQAGDSLALRPAGTPASRGAGVLLADQLGGVLPIAPRQAQGRSFALHPSLGAVQQLFGAGRLAIVANVGPLLQPTTKAGYLAKTVARPARLFSHNDQQSTWQALGPEGTAAGWGGRLAERYLDANGRSMFASVSLAGASVWASGQQSRPYQLATGSLGIGGGSGGTLYGSALAQQKLLAVMRGGRSSHPLAADHAAVSGRASDAATVLGAALPAAGDGPWGSAGAATPAADPLLRCIDPTTGVAETNPLAVQLQSVLRMIAARATLGLTRQVFYVSLDGFDTHDDQMRKHAVLLARLAHGLGYLDSTLATMGLSDRVTTFTASDFGRAFSSNGDGSDHGWGGHHFVLGGAVKGGDIYGRFPVYATGDSRGEFASDDQLANGVLLPQASVDQYGATLARWFGLSSTDAAGVFGNLNNFGSSSRNLGFMA